jgi:hypothetical protein
MAERPHIEGPVHCDVPSLSAMKGFEPLAEFCCGHCGLDPSAKEVNDEAARLYCGGKADLGGPRVHAVILLLDEADTVLGFSGMEIENGDLANGSFIQVYGREKRLKGHLLADNKTTLGDALLRACLELAAHRTQGPKTPVTYALTQLDNAVSQDVLRRLDFEAVTTWERVQGPGGGYQRRYTVPKAKPFLHPQQLSRRPSGPPLSPLPAEVYVGPVP